MSITHPIDRRFADAVMKYITDRAEVDWHDAIQEGCYDGDIVRSFYDLLVLVMGEAEDDEINVYEACLEQLTPVESAKLTADVLTHLHKTSSAFAPFGMWLPNPFHRAMLIWEKKLVNGVQHEWECARRIQSVWRGYNARWKCPCFSFKDTDGTVPLAKKQRTEWKEWWVCVCVCLERPSPKYISFPYTAMAIPISNPPTQLLFSFGRSKHKHKHT